MNTAIPRRQTQHAGRPRPACFSRRPPNPSTPAFPPTWLRYRNTTESVTRQGDGRRSGERRRPVQPSNGKPKRSCRGNFREASPQPYRHSHADRRRSHQPRRRDNLKGQARLRRRPPQRGWIARKRRALPAAARPVDPPRRGRIGTETREGRLRIARRGDKAATLAACHRQRRLSSRPRTFESTAPEVQRHGHVGDECDVPESSR